MLFGLPISLWGSVFGAVTGFFTKRASMMAELQAAERKHQIEMISDVSKANRSGTKDEIKLLKAKAQYEKALSEADPHRSEARRYIAYVMVLSLAVLIPAIVLFGGDWSWFQIHQWTNNGFFGLGRKEVIDVVSAVGLPLIWLEGITTLVATIIGFYFGTGASKFNNPYIERK